MYFDNRKDRNVSKVIDIFNQQDIAKQTKQTKKSTLEMLTRLFQAGTQVICILCLEMGQLRKVVSNETYNVHLTQHNRCSKFLQCVFYGWSIKCACMLIWHVK